MKSMAKLVMHGTAITGGVVRYYRAVSAWNDAPFDDVPWTYLCRGSRHLSTLRVQFFVVQGLGVDDLPQRLPVFRHAERGAVLPDLRPVHARDAQGGHQYQRGCKAPAWV
jgi:hypothetical protein